MTLDEQNAWLHVHLSEGAHVIEELLELVAKLERRIEALEKELAATELGFPPRLARSNYDSRQN